jgi:Biopolymer transport protein
MGKRKESEGCALDMTPMIDVVFQLMIFFIVTITMSEAKDETVRLELGPTGPEIETGGEAQSSALIIDISEKGRVSINNMTYDTRLLRTAIRNRVKRAGNADAFQIWIRGDARVRHIFVKNVMDICTDEGVSRVHFIAVKDVRTEKTREFQKSRPKPRR